MKAFSIKNYKNLPNLRLENLTRVNLIVGNNNVGKSTLLEALALRASNGNLSTMYEILDTRGEVYKFREYSEKALEKEIDSFCSLFSGREFDGFLREGITLTSEGENGQTDSLELKLQKFETTTHVGEDGSSYRATTPVDASTPMSESVVLSIFVSNGDFARDYGFNGRYRRFPIEEKKNYEYVKTSQIKSARNAELFDGIALTNLETEIIKALKIIDERIEKINFLKDNVVRSENDRVPFVVFRNDTKKYRLSSMGDGINRILTIILSLLNCQGGVLLIDEFENGLHYSVQTQLWKIINELAGQLDVQVFATTHSKDCIRSFANSVENENGLVIRLQQSAKGIVPVYFSDYKDVLFALDNDIDIR